MQKVTHEKVADAVACDKEELHVVAACERTTTGASSRLSACSLRCSDLRRAVDRGRTLGDRRRRVALLVFRGHCVQEAAVVVQREAQRAHRQLVHTGRRGRLGLEASFEREFTWSLCTITRTCARVPVWVVAAASYARARTQAQAVEAFPTPTSTTNAAAGTTTQRQRGHRVRRGRRVFSERLQLVEFTATDSGSFGAKRGTRAPRDERVLQQHIAQRKHVDAAPQSEQCACKFYCDGEHPTAKPLQKTFQN